MKIILDTNFCLIPFEFKVDVIEEIKRIIHEKAEIIIPDLVIEELKDMSKKKGKRGVYAKNAIEYFSRFKKVKVKKIDGVDDSIIRFAKENKCVIATQDKEMKRKARKERIPIITMRQKKYLIFLQ